MSNRTYSNKDSELLSAYLDNQLESNERASLEQRLHADSSLRVELEELRATVALCKQIEPIIPPRSFTLDVATIQQRQPFWQLWQHRWLRLSSSVLAMIFGIVVITAIYSHGSFQEKVAQVAPTIQIVQDEQADIATREAPNNVPALAPPQEPKIISKPDPESPAAVAVVSTQMGEGEEAGMVADLAADERLASETMTDTEYVEQPEDPEWTRPSVAAKPYTPPAVLDEEEALEARPSFVVRHSPIPEVTPSPMSVAGALDVTKTEDAENGATSASAESASSPSSPDSFPLVWVIIPLLLIIALSGAWFYLRNRKI